MRVTIIAVLDGEWDDIYVGRQGRSSGCLYFFGASHIEGDEEDERRVGDKVEIDEWCLEVPEKEMKRLSQELEDFSEEIQRMKDDIRERSIDLEL